MSNYQTIIGIEVHAELNTKHKIFSPSINDINAKPNTNVHPIDLAMPGTLPRFNEEVLHKAVRICDAFNMDITKTMQWDRKNYFYPDNPKGYQITQQETPIGRNGQIVLDSGKVITIDFMHMEEDTAKSFHASDQTLLDFNRCGVPLVEIVSGPDMNSAVEAREYLEKLREMLLYLDVSDCKMQEGSLRVDVNVSVRPFGQDHFNPKVEIKNLNSFQNVVQAIEMETKEQSFNYNNNIETKMCTKRFNEELRRLDVMRIKESKDDYRFMAEPDLPHLVLTEEKVLEYTKDMPLLPTQIRAMLKEDLQLDTKITEVLMSNRDLTMFLLTCVDSGLDAKQTVNYLTSNVNEYLNKTKCEFKDLAITIEHFKELEQFLEAGKISTNHVKKIIPTFLEKELSVAETIKLLRIEQISDPKVILEFVTQAIEANPESIVDFKNGKDRAFGFLIGVIMKLSKGQASPQLVNQILTQELEKH